MINSENERDRTFNGRYDFPMEKKFSSMFAVCRSIRVNSQNKLTDVSFRFSSICNHSNLIEEIISDIIKFLRKSFNDLSEQTNACFKKRTESS